MIRYLPGFLWVTIVCTLALAITGAPGLTAASPLMLAIVLGIAARAGLGVPPSAIAGIALCTRVPLRWGIVLLGSQLVLTDIVDLGPLAFGILAAAVAASYAFTMVLGRTLKVEPTLVRLIAFGTAICGASAIAAAASTVRSKEGSVAYALMVVTLCGTGVMLLYPALAAALVLNAGAHGFWIGASIHEIAQVMAAADLGQPAAAAIATATKLTRVLLLVPLLLLAGSGNRSGTHSGKPHARQVVPWFVVGFVAMAVVTNAGWLPPRVIEATATAARLLLCVALAGVGLETCLVRLAASGFAPVLLAAASTAFLGGTTLVLAILIFGY